ncbi:MAG: aminotransferase class V-fold PLP-dependent enzyme, partial [Cyanobacteria bacterium J06648_11]
GVGALFIRRRAPRVYIAAQMQGGGQERERRSGTLNPPLIVGFAKAVEIALSRQSADTQRLLALRSQLWKAISSLFPEATLNGAWQPRLPGNLNISFPGLDSSTLLAELRATIALSSGSACSSASGLPSHVLTALGRSDRLARSSLRFGLHREMSDSDMARAIASFAVIAEKPRSSLEPTRETAPEASAPTA